MAQVADVKKALEVDPVTGLHVMDPEKSKNSVMKMTIGACVVPVIFSIFFGGIFCLIYFFGNKDKYDA